MPSHPSGYSDWTILLDSILASHSRTQAWITDADGNVFKANERAAKFFNPPSFREILSKHKTKIDSSFPRSITVEMIWKTSLQEKSTFLLSGSKIQIQSVAYYLFVDLNPETTLPNQSVLLEASELGIYGWKYFPQAGKFYLPERAWKELLGIHTQSPGYEDFYSCFSAESLQKFSLYMENVINFGQSFSGEFMIDLPAGYSWVFLACKKEENSQGNWHLSGYLKDLGQEKVREAEWAQMQQWLNAGLADFKIESAGGEVLRHWKGHSTGPNIFFEGNSRITHLVDFRNNLKYKIQASLGQGLTSVIPEAKEQMEEPTKTDNLPQSEAGPHNLLKGNRDQKFVTVNQWLGQSLDAKVSAMGVFNGRDFEWKAWWKSPIRYELPVDMPMEDWRPPLDWLSEVERDKESQSIWWPQEMLPFSIENQFGEGWMLLTDTISEKETTLFAIQSDDPASIREKTRHVLKGISLLKKEEAKALPTNELDRLRQQLAERDLLIKELNHRAKNNLSIASGLLKLQTGYAEDPESVMVLKQTQKRLETLAGLHEHLYHTGNQQGLVDMQEFLTKIVQSLMDGFSNGSVELEMHLDRVMLDSKIANTIGLLVNELISNSFKYAFSQIPKGLLKVDFHHKGEIIKLRVSDNGPGLKGEKKEGSLGELLISEFVAQLKGQMEIVSPPGTTYLITFAMP